MTNQTPSTRACAFCDAPMTDRRDGARYCSNTCRYRAANARTSATRGADDSCAVPGCESVSRKRRFYVHRTPTGRKVTLCGLHHIGKYRHEGNGDVPITGRSYRGYQHENFADHEDDIDYDDGGIDQLCRYLSGDDVPHPNVDRIDDRVEYANPFD